MKNKLVTPLLFLALCSTALNACVVSAKKYTALEERNNKLRRDSIQAQQEILGLNGALSKLKIEKELSQTQLAQRNNLLDSNNETIQAQQARLAALQKSIDDQKQAIENIKQAITKALGNFSSEQLNVFQKNGKVYVSMSEQLLFESGSAEVQAMGKSALESLAKALNENPSININIEGHTDTVPVVKRFPDNWALSVARSTAVARILIKDYQVPASRIVCSGRSQFLPIADNASAEGRAKNRRTEIILEPQLDRILEWVEGTNKP